MEDVWNEYSCPWWKMNFVQTGLRAEVGYLNTKFLTECTRNKVNDFVSLVPFQSVRALKVSGSCRKFDVPEMRLTNLCGLV